MGAGVAVRGPEDRAADAPASELVLRAACRTGRRKRPALCFRTLNPLLTLSWAAFRGYISTASILVKRKSNGL
jgi:hypothetical protein